MSEAPRAQDDLRLVTDERDWRAGVHGGARRLRFRSLPRAAFVGAEAGIAS
jgi:hypothetical protein